MISVSFYCTIISLSKILGYTDLTGVCVVCVRGSQLLSLIILELEYFGGRCSAKYVNNYLQLYLLGPQKYFEMPFNDRNFLFLAPEIHKSVSTLFV